MTLRPKKKKTYAVLDMWRRMPLLTLKPRAGVAIPIMPKMRGDTEASVLIIAPPCDVEEYENEAPMSNGNAMRFHQIVEKEADRSTNACLVVSCSRYGVKPNKASTEDIREFLRGCVLSKQFKFYICVGDEAFKHIFGRGKKSSMVAIAGNIMYVPEINHAPLFVFPALDGLCFEPAPAMKRNEVARAADWSEKVNLRFIELAQKLKAATEKHDY